MDEQFDRAAAVAYEDAYEISSDTEADKFDPVDVDTKEGATKFKPECSHEGTGENCSESILECSVCLQPCQLPVQLPCRHIFCFLCVKGVVSRSKGCALCRRPIPSDFLYKPNLIFHEDLDRTVTFDDGYGWFYEGLDGWWQYDDRNSKELEMHHKAGHPSCELLIAGYVYLIDLTNMVQSRRTDRTRKRRVKRDLVSIQGRKGVAGLKISTETVSTANDRPGADGHETNAASGNQSIPIRQVHRSSAGHSYSPPTPHNTPQTPMTPSESPPTNGPTECDLTGPLRGLRRTDSFTPSPASPQEGSLESDFVSLSMEDVRASLQQFQSETNGHNLSEANIFPTSTTLVVSSFTNGSAECDITGPFQGLGLTEDFAPSSACPQELYRGPNHDSSDIARPSMEDARDTSQELQSETGGHNLPEASEDGEHFVGDFCD